MTKPTAPYKGMQRGSAKAWKAAAGCALAMLAAGCGGNGTSSSTSGASPAPSDPQIYLAPPVAGSPATNNVAAYAFDGEKNTFTQTTYAFSATQELAQVNYAGNVSTLDRNLLELALTYTDLPPGCTTGFCPTSFSTPLPYGWALQLAGEAGGLVQLSGQPVTPIVGAQGCPGTTPRTYQFVTIPAPVSTNPLGAIAWDPTLDTAYGTTEVSASGTTVTFDKTQQFALGSSTPLQKYASLSGSPAAETTQSGTCASTFYGNTISVPFPLAITDPGANQTVVPGAVAGIGPSGLLVESNGNTKGSYQPFLGAGTGAIGLPQPSSALSTSAVAGAQYLGFVYGTGASGTGGALYSSTVASFGFSAAPASCASVAPASATLIYGGDFPNNDPSSAAVQANGGYGNCDLAIDLGTQSPTGNGLYPDATVYIGSAFSANPQSAAFSFPAVAIAGQLNGKYAIFAVGAQGAIQGWGIYLLQSN